MKSNTNWRKFFGFFFAFGFFTLYAQDNVSFNANQSYGCEPFNLVLTNTSSFTVYQGEVNYTWYVNGNFAGNNPAVLDTFLNRGNHNCNLEARDTSGNFLGSYQMNYEVSAMPDQIIISSGAEICPGQGVDFHVDVNQDFVSYANWNLGNGFEQYGLWISTAYADTGYYNVSLSIGTICGVDTLTRMVHVTQNATPEVKAFIQSGDRYCPNDDAYFHLDGSYKSAHWDFGDGAAADVLDSRHAYTTTGNYDVIVTATNICNHSSNDTLRITVENNIESWADFDYWFEGSYGNNCPNIPVKFNPHSAGNYYWEFGDGGSSTNMFPVNIYADSGTYIAKLIVTNGCGHSDTSYQSIIVEYKTYETFMGDVRFRFENVDDNMIDTISICPNEKVGFINETSSENEVQFQWDFGDGITSQSVSGSHVFTQSQLHNVVLQAKDNCGRTGSSVKYVLVDPLRKPEANLQAVPMDICPGEEVYFFDDNYEDNHNYSYSVWFGDGTSATNITAPTDSNLQTIANHQYDIGGTYNFVFRVTNKCNNTDSLTGTINVTNDANRKPFYYISNSTYDENKQEPPDWGIRQNTDDHEIRIPVLWSQWTPPMNNNFFVFLWYGNFNPEASDPGPPDGIVKFHSNTIATGDTATAYVPIDPMNPSSVGIAAGWFCDTTNIMDDEPESWGMPDSMGIPVQSIPISPSGFTDLSLKTTGGFIFLQPWDGVCNNMKVDGSWESLYDGKFSTLEMWKDTGLYNLFTSTDEFNAYQNFISDGNYLQHGDTLEFSSMTGYCSGLGTYTYTLTDQELNLSLISDNCTERKNALTSATFTRNDNQKDDRTGCPGDPVKFSIAGGISYEWHFGDGTPVSTDQFAYHAYQNTGTYNAWAKATNACGRVDTLVTKVEISNTNMPEPWFYFNDYGTKIRDTLHFFYEVHDNPQLYSTFQFNWDFGDGNTSTIMNPVHIYYQPGEYNVKLTVTNGCGTRSDTKKIYVEDIWDNCDLQAKFSFQIHGDTVYFSDASTGSSISKRIWSFGDLSGSTTKNPVHVYADDGKYTICLSVFDSVNNCTDQICKEVIIGTPGFYADFIFTQNNTTNTVFFTDKSLNATNWYWNFDNIGSSVVKDPVFQFPGPGYYQVCLTARNNLDNSADTKCEVIQVGELDTADCHVTFSYFVEDMKVNFTSSISGTVTGGQWDFGDGTRAFDPNPQHIYLHSGIYPVKAMVFNTNNGCQAEETKYVTVGTIACQAAFDYLVDPETREVDFINKSTGPATSWQWNLGDGTIVNAHDTSHIYSQGDVYPVCLVVSGSEGCYSQTCKEIRISAPEDKVCDAKFTYIIEENTRNVKFIENSPDTFTYWSWSFGDNTVGTGMTANHTYLRDDVFDVCLMAKNNLTECFSQKCKLVSVISSVTEPALIADFSYVITSGTKTVKVINQSTGAPTGKYWTFGDGSLSVDLDTVIHTYNYAKTYPVCLYLSDDNTGKTSKSCKDVLIPSTQCNVDADFIYFIDQDTKEVVFKNKSSDNVNSWFWKFDDGTTSSKPNPLHTYANPGFYLVSQSVRDTINKCTDFKSAFLQVGNADCRADFSYDVDPETKTVTFTNLSSGDAANNFWLFDDHAFSEEENPVYTFESSGLHTVSLTVSDNSGLCFDNRITQIQVGSAECDGKFNVYVDSVSNTAYFTSELYGDVTRVNWKFGDGNISENENPVHTYLAPGYYTVGLYSINESNGCINYYEDVVLIGSQGEDCEANFVHQPGESPLQIKFFDKSNGSGLTYFWDFGDGITSTDQNPEHTYTDGDYYNVCLTVVNDQSIQNTTCKFLQVQPGSSADCYAKFVYSVDSSMKKVLFIDKSYGNPDAWDWDFGNNTTSTIQNPENTYDTSGYYTVRLLTSNTTTNCNSAHYEIVNVGKGNQGLIAGFGYEMDTSRQKNSGYPVDFIGISTGKASAFQWDFGDGSPIVTSTTTPTHVYASAGVYNICFTVSDPVTRQSNSTCQQLSVGVTSNITNKFVNDGYFLDCYPNPFNHSTTIKYQLPESSTVDILWLLND